MRSDSPLRRAALLAVLVCVGLGGVAFASCSGLDEPQVTPTPTRTPRPTPTPTPSPTSTPAWPVTIFVPYGLPAPVAAALDETITSHPDLFARSLEAAAADVVVTLGPDPGAVPLAQWIFALVAPFPTMVDEASWQQVADLWAGNPSDALGGELLLMAAETAATLTAGLGKPAAETVALLPPEELLQRAWETRTSWAIIPFEALEPRWKVLRLEGTSVIDQDLDATAYPLAVHVVAQGLDRGVTRLAEVYGKPLTNRDPDRMSVVMLTGVTALARATALRMERYGPTYPARDIADWLVEPDITHISNEVSFAENCPPPSDYQTMVFCSSPSYIELFEETDIDVVELTGNHLVDWGVEAMSMTLAMYRERGLPYFGGGTDLTEALTPLTITVGADTFGFLGCNVVGPEYDWATEVRPGSAPCDYDMLTGQIRQMRDDGIIPIVTLQYWEFYQYEPTTQQQRDFRALAEAGAAIVSGSQAHHPQGFEFHEGALIHYGLGNLFFDQMWSLGTRQEFLDRHVFYEGRHISTELLTVILEDYARPRPMTPEEREELLGAAFAASGW